MKSDIDGNLPLSPVVLGQVQLPITILESALTQPNFYQKIKLPILCNNRDSGKKMSLCFGHQEIPGIIHNTSLNHDDLQNKLDIQKYFDKPNKLFNGNENENEDESHISIEIERILHLSEIPLLHPDHEIYIVCFLDNLPSVSRLSPHFSFFFYFFFLIFIIIL